MRKHTTERGIMDTLVSNNVCAENFSARNLDGRSLSRGLDNAIANNVAEFVRRPDVDVSEAEVRRRGFLAHELRNHLQNALLALHVMRSVDCCVAGGAVGTLERSLGGLRELIDRSVSEVRLTAGLHHKERIRVADLIEEMEAAASMEAARRGLQFDVERGDDKLLVDVDRQFLASAISNLLQNAFKFTRPSSHVRLRTGSRGGTLSIEVEDECGGLPPGATEALFRPFEQRGADRRGMGLGLAISREAVEADGGRISVRDIPGTGCVFTVEMPLAVDLRG
jgi:signal transduction histidine kinase